MGCRGIAASRHLAFRLAAIFNRPPGGGTRDRCCGLPLEESLSTPPTRSREVMAPTVVYMIRPHSPCWLAMSNLQLHGYRQDADDVGPR